MARMLYQRESTAMYLRMGRRHIRLCGQVKGTGKFAEKMRQPLDILIGKEKERIEATYLRENAYDDVVLRDGELDNAVRTTYEKIKQYDRENNTLLLGLFFPSHGFHEIINKPYSEEPQEVKNIVVKLEGLEDGHVLKTLGNDLLQKVEASFAAWDAYGKAISRLKELRAAEELSKFTVRQQYESNWLDARKEFGVALADSIFPKITKRAVKDEEDGDSNLLDEQ